MLRHLIISNFIITIPSYPTSSNFGIIDSTVKMEAFKMNLLFSISDNFTGPLLTTLFSIRNNTKEEFDYYKKHCKTNVSVRKDSIKMYVSPIAQNYIEFNYPYDDTIDFIDNLSYDDYIDMIGNLDFSNYSCMFIKKGSIINSVGEENH